MNKFKIIRLSIATVLAAGAITFGIIGGRKTAACVSYANEVNECTKNIDSLMKSDLTYEYNKPGTENYNKVKGWEEERKNAEANYNENEENNALFVSIAFVCLFGLIYIGVDSLRTR